MNAQGASRHARWQRGSLLLGAVLAGAACDAVSSGATPAAASGGSASAVGSSDAGGGDSVTTGGTDAATGAAPAAGAAVAATGGTAATAGGGGAGGQAGCRAFVAPADCTVPDGGVLPADLWCTGLYAELGSYELACGVRRYAPAYALWADGAGKERYVLLPPGTTIDVSDPNDFVYPVGTKFWKVFRVGPEGEQRLGETRFLEKQELGWVYTAYVWDEEGTSAVQTNDGVEDLFQSGHRVPSREQCKACHSGRRDYVLGWDFLLLGDGATGTTREDLAANGLLDGLDPALLETAVPGDAVERRALAYLHVNCGVSCHNETTNATGRPSGLFLRLEVGELDDPHATDAVTSGVNRPPTPNAELVGLPEQPAGYYDFRPLDPQRSLAVARMEFRGSPTAMPPLGTHVVDPDGVDAVTAWIGSMTEVRGYPPPAL